MGWRRVTWLGVAAAGLLGALVCLYPRSHAAAAPAGLVPSLEAAAFAVDGRTLAVVAGDAWEKTGAGWTLVRRLYDPGFYAKNYAEHDGRIFRKADDGREIAVRREFRSGFEDGAALRDLIGETPGWTQFTLQSPQAREVRDYVALRTRILAGTGVFLDNRVEPVTDRVHSGTRALRCTAVATGRGMVCSKASLSTELLHFVRGDTVRFSGWYWTAQELEFATLMDLESVWIEFHPGPRITVNQGALGVELKWGAKPKYRQSPEHAVKLPLNRWVRIECELLLDERDGRVRLWQDGQLLLDQRGQTLPLADTILNDLEIGLSATTEAAVIHVDDIEIRVIPPLDLEDRP
jgi:hypothetical protein